MGSNPTARQYVTNYVVARGIPKKAPALPFFKGWAEQPTPGSHCAPPQRGPGSSARAAAGGRERSSRTGVGTSTPRAVPLPDGFFRHNFPLAGAPCRGRARAPERRGGAEPSTRGGQVQGWRFPRPERPLPLARAQPLPSFQGLCPGAQPQVSFGKGRGRRYLMAHTRDGRRGSESRPLQHGWGMGVWRRETIKINKSMKGVVGAPIEGLLRGQKS